MFSLCYFLHNQGTDKEDSEEQPNEQSNLH